MNGEMQIFGMGVSCGLASRDLVKKFLGPTADFLGERLKDHVQRGYENAARVFNIACRNASDTLDQPGVVSPRILKGVLEEAPYTDDALTAEYFGGLLASSRDEHGSDDLLPHINLVKQLPARQLRLHFIVYASVAMFGKRAEMRTGPDFWNGLRLHIPVKDLDRCWPEWKIERGRLIGNALQGLIDQGLIGRSSSVRIAAGDPPTTAKLGLDVAPVRRGCDLFLKALGLLHRDPDEACSPEVTSRIASSADGVTEVPGDARCSYVLVHDPRDRVQDLVRDVNDLKRSMKSVSTFR